MIGSGFRRHRRGGPVSRFVTEFSSRFGFILCANSTGTSQDDSMSSDSPAPDEPSPDAAQPAPQDDALPESAVVFTRAAALWTSLITGFLVLIVLLIFITQNTASAQFAFLGWRWTLPLGVAILLAAVGGGMISVIAGTARIYQLRRAAKKNLAARR